ncbi:unnamed protein product [Rotaria magnacalcarata]|uniref:SAC3/GANP/THP3 conserved domain-containing protein n=1 Tax=Rotaria magnacalcarata TaxID=392030 RepID=A0A816VSH7_9BILA|nr:unnamed protein product [Rotaria magnacalcarata]CAF3814987.1 unnamed protein product [Rotaria magnacalcarata]CAF3862967.1 unnamed protein product [Rotaria magnacalcarata]
MSQSTTAASNSGFFPGYFSGNGNNQPPLPLMSTMPIPPPLPPSDSMQPPPPAPPPSSGSTGDLLPPPPMSALPKLDTSVPPPPVACPPDVYQAWALQWSYYQQAQQVAAYQNQLYQSFANQQKATPQSPNPVPSVHNNTSNGFNNQQNHNMNTAQSNWQQPNPSPSFRPRQAQQSHRARFSANNNQQQQQYQSYNNVPPPSNITQSKPQQSGIRFQLNTRPQTTVNRGGRRTRFSSPPKQQTASSSSSSVSYPTPMTMPDHRNDVTSMDTNNASEQRPIMSAIEAFKLACDKQSWPESLKTYWQSIENRCTTDLLRSQAQEWFQGVLVDAFQKNLVKTIDWINRPIPEFLRSDSSSNVRSNVFDSSSTSLLQIAKSSYAENKQREDLSRLNKLRQIASESAQRAFADDDDDDNNNNNENSSSRKRSSSSSSSSSSSNDNDNNNCAKNTTSPPFSNSASRKRAKKPRRARRANKKMQLEESSKPEHTERLEKRRNRFTNETISAIIKPIQAPSLITVSDSTKVLVGTSQKLEKNYLRLTSEADPATIRPISILERAFSFVMDKYRLNKEWSYISDQLKSIRQDLMVQSIRNDFTVLVYEENARISLEMGDREQFNQCQTQLETLYDNGCNRSHINEFLVYRLLYSLLLNDYKKTTRILIDIDTVKKTAAANGKSKAKDIEHINLALELCTAIRRKNYIRFFIIYRSLPQLASCLVNLFIDIYRKQVLKVLLWGFAPSFPIEAITEMLAYGSNDTCQKHLTTLGITLIDESSSGVSIDCKASRAIFEKK